MSLILLLLGGAFIGEGFFNHQMWMGMFIGFSIWLFIKLMMMIPSTGFSSSVGVDDVYDIFSGDD